MKKRVFTLLKIIVSLFIIILWFCPILIINRGSPEESTNEIIVSPFLSAFSISTIFLMLIPVMIFLISNVISLKYRTKLFLIVNFVFSLYILLISIIYQFVYAFALVGNIFASLLPILIVFFSIADIFVFSSLHLSRS